MDVSEQFNNWKGKKVLLIGEALTDRYIFGNADSISPDAPVPNVKINESKTHLGAIGLVLQYVRSLGGDPDICTILGNDYEGDFFYKELKRLNFPTENVIIDENITTPQITRIKAMGQHVLRLETDFSNELSSETVKDILSVVETQSNKYDSIVILDYGAGELFQDVFIQQLLNILKSECKDSPIIARPHTVNYFLYENIDLIKINLQKALNQFSIDCCTETSVSIVGKRILNSARCKNVFLNYLETESYLFTKNQEKVEIFQPILDQPVRSFVAVGSAIMAVLGLALAANIPVSQAVQTSLYAAVLSAISPPVDFFSANKLVQFITSRN
jgi:D-beta-D-heptose 7-phosphate kinase / D-beta-D-heptose 1-phosphate adenosyltransferase